MLTHCILKNVFFHFALRRPNFQWTAAVSEVFRRKGTSALVTGMVDAEVPGPANARDIRDELLHLFRRNRSAHRTSPQTNANM